MTKVRDRYARQQGRLTIVALANLIATVVDTMRAADVPNDIVHHFLDRLESLNDLTLTGLAGDLLGDVVAVVRATVPGND